MSGFNLPPGCSVRDLPGAETSSEEAFYDNVCDILAECGVPDEKTAEISERLQPLINEALHASYKDGGAEADIAFEEFLLDRDISEVSAEDIINAFGASNTVVAKLVVGLARRIPERKMPYRVMKTTNRWNERGERIDVQDYFFSEAETLVGAFKIITGRRNPVSPVSIIFHVYDEYGVELALIDAYRHVVGEEVFQAQLADENFSINLDEWLKGM